MQVHSTKIFFSRICAFLRPSGLIYGIKKLKPKLTTNPKQKPSTTDFIIENSINDLPILWRFRERGIKTQDVPLVRPGRGSPWTGQLFSPATVHAQLTFFHNKETRVFLLTASLCFSCIIRMVRLGLGRRLSG